MTAILAEPNSVPDSFSAFHASLLVANSRKRKGDAVLRRTWKKRKHWMGTGTGMGGEGPQRGLQPLSTGPGLGVGGSWWGL